MRCCVHFFICTLSYRSSLDVCHTHKKIQLKPKIGNHTAATPSTDICLIPGIVLSVCITGFSIQFLCFWRWGEGKPKKTWQPCQPPPPHIFPHLFAAFVCFLVRSPSPTSSQQRGASELLQMYVGCGMMLTLSDKPLCVQKGVFIEPIRDLP